MATLHDETAGGLVAERPGRARVFEEYGTDSCCGGRRSLREVSASRGLSREEVLRRLADAERPADEPDWTIAPLGRLCDHLFPRAGRLADAHRGHSGGDR